MRAVFDLDDTICVHENRDYVNAKPIKGVISKIRDMKRDGWEIIIYSSRGQVSCKGDLQEIEKRNRKTVEDWLVRNGVPFDEIVFGKPIADVYIDDKAMNVVDFEKHEFCALHGGGSKRSIYRIGNVVKKDLGSPEDVRRFREWINDGGVAFRYPRVISFLYNGLYMDYIDGQNLVNACTAKDIDDILETIWRFRGMRKSEFTLAPQIEILRENKSDDAEWNELVDISERFLLRNKHVISENASYCHGDLILSNVIKSVDGLYLIDPRYFRDSSSYLLDLGKLRMSLMDYEYRFGLATERNSRYLPSFDKRMEEEGIKGVVVGLNLMYICRLYRYKNESEREIVKGMAREVIDGNRELFRE